MTSKKKKYINSFQTWVGASDLKRGRSLALFILTRAQIQEPPTPPALGRQLADPPSCQFTAKSTAVAILAHNYTDQSRSCIWSCTAFVPNYIYSPYTYKTDLRCDKPLRCDFPLIPCHRSFIWTLPSTISVVFNNLSVKKQNTSSNSIRGKMQLFEKVGFGRSKR